MDDLLSVPFALVLWFEDLPPVGVLLALPLLGALWFVVGCRSRLRRARPVTASLVRTWAAMLGLSCLAFLLAWSLRDYSIAIDLGVLRLSPPDGALLVALAAPAHALRSTLAMLLSGSAGPRSPGKGWISSAAWMLFSGVMLLWLHGLLMALVFPFGGGEFHAMFAYTDGGRPDAAVFTWRASVVILGFSAVVFAAWVPLRWWVLALLAAVVGVYHWWAVCTWTPQSPEFHRAAIRLLLALPVAVLLSAGAGAWLRSAWGAYRPRPAPRYVS